MSKRTGTAGRVVFALILALAIGTAVGLATLHFRARSHFVQRPGARMAALPRVTLWAWERPEYFAASADGQSRYAIAYLDRTIEVSPAGVVDKPRMVPVTFPVGAVRIAVVRIEVATGSDLTSATLAQVTRLLLESASRPGLAAFQIDFDARRSERDFYRQLLGRVRAAMPSVLPLSMTALASWCAADDWLANLPVDEAVPMLFRMEPAWRHAELGFGDFKMREPLCAGAIGLADRGSWPPITEGRRIYLFADDGWSLRAVESALSRIH